MIAKTSIVVQLAGDTVAELEAMKAENIQLSSEAVMHNGELQACKHGLAKLTTALEVMPWKRPLAPVISTHVARHNGGPSHSVMSAEGCSFPRIVHIV